MKANVYTAQDILKRLYEAEAALTYIKSLYRRNPPKLITYALEHVQAESKRIASTLFEV